MPTAFYGLVARLAALALVAAIAPATIHAGPATETGRQPATAEPVIVAHRGAMSERPENTMAAFDRALELGADVVEVDVRQSRDGRLVVMHDATVDRTTDGSGLVSALDADEILAFDAGSWFDEAHAGERVPTLRQVLRWGAGRTCLLLDLKQTDAAFVEAVAGAVEEHGDQERVIIGVRSPAQAREFREKLPDCRQLAFMARPELIEEFAEAGADVLRLWLRWLEPGQAPDAAGRVRATGRLLMINGSDGSPEETQALLAHAPDWILIDDVHQLRQSLERLRAVE